MAYCAQSLGSNESVLLDVTAVFCGIVVVTGIALIVSSTALHKLARARLLIPRTRSTFVSNRQPLRTSGQLCHKS